MARGIQYGFEKPRKHHKKTLAMLENEADSALADFSASLTEFLAKKPPEPSASD